jgi:hypothetical protein
MTQEQIERITLRWIFKNDGRAWTGFAWLSTETTDKLL